MTGNKGIAGIGVLTLKDMNVAAADAGRHHFNLNLIVLGFRNGDLAHLEFMGFNNNNFLHDIFHGNTPFIYAR